MEADYRMSDTRNLSSKEEPTELSSKGQQGITAAREAVARAIERHRRLGESIVIWRDGQIVIVPPEEIPPRELNDLSSGKSQI